MPFTADELSDINVGVLETYIDKGKIWKQNVQNKPLLNALNDAAGKFTTGKEFVSYGVKSGQGGGALAGFNGDDQVAYYNPLGLKRARVAWKEHHIGMVVTQTELKYDGIDIVEENSRADQQDRPQSDREMQALANLLDEKNDALGEDYAFSLNRLLYGDGTTDAKAIAGIRSWILDAPTLGSSGGISRVANTWWRNRAATTANASAGGQGPITVSNSNGGALITFMDKEKRQRARYASGATKVQYFAGSDFIEGYKQELRANGWYTNQGWQGSVKPDGFMDDPMIGGVQLQYDPTLDDLGYNKRCYAIDMGRAGLRLLYADGMRMKRHNPARPYDRYVMYNGITMTGVLVAKQLNTSGVYDIA